MKYRVIVKQVIIEEREVQADSINELHDKLEDQGQFIGRCVKPAEITELVGMVFDEDGRSMGTANFN
jgi:hypothetical protein